MTTVRFKGDISKCFDRDSTLRGNVAAELAAVGAAWEGAPVVYLPAYPKLGRTVRDGELRVDGRPVSQTAFASDRWNPVRESHIPTLLQTARLTLPLTALRPEQIHDSKGRRSMSWIARAKKRPGHASKRSPDGPSLMSWQVPQEWHITLRKLSNWPGERLPHCRQSGTASSLMEAFTRHPGIRFSTRLREDCRPSG